MFYVYILYPPKFNKYYIGQTNSFEKRLLRHNSGYENYTKSYIPWQLILTIEKPTRSQSMILERKLKNLSKERLLNFIEKYKK